MDSGVVFDIFLKKENIFYLRGIVKVFFGFSFLAALQTLY